MATSTVALSIFEGLRYWILHYIEFLFVKKDNLIDLFQIQKIPTVENLNLV
jgi:hypothetical protein